jgi:hypothetical protein
MFSSTSSSVSCGVTEVYDLFQPTTVRDIREFWRTRKPYTAFVVFSDSKGCGNGDRLATVIRKHKLGSVTGTVWKRNPNTGNEIKVWIWSL